MHILKKWCAFSQIVIKMDKKCKKCMHESPLIDRDLSWLEFNSRVLDQAAELNVPLFERIQFSAIYTSNNDEFFEVRVAEALNKAILCQNAELLKEIHGRVKKLAKRQENIDKNLIAELRKVGINFCTWNDLSKSERKYARMYFKEKIIPHLTVHKIDKKQPLPFIESMNIGALMSHNLIEKNRTNRNDSYYFITISKQVPAYIKIESKDAHKILSIERLLLKMLPMTTNIQKPYDVTLFRIIRSADMPEISKTNKKGKKYREEIKNMLIKRDLLSAVRLDIFESVRKNSKRNSELLKTKYGLDSTQIYRKKVSLSDGWKKQIRGDFGKLFPDLSYNPLQKCPVQSDDLLKRIQKSDIFLNYPYHSVDTYLNFLHEAIDDKDTKSIKITLYRLGKRSKIIALLSAAAVRGIEVTAVIELRARFDEESNIEWAEVLENAGCKVIYGLPPYKVHAKVTLIEQYCSSHYAHIATGNYNEITSDLYTDVGILTSNQEICADAADLFRNIAEGIISENYRKLLVAPSCLKNKIIEEINIEAQKAEKGYICMKMNSLTDEDVINALIIASCAGTKIDLIVRGICCLRPGIIGKTENIRVISIVGRYLEHSRIYIFGENAHIRRTYIGSADMMVRNTTKRIEVLTPVENRQIAETLYELTRFELADNIKASEMQSNGHYAQIRSADGIKQFDSQIELYGLYNSDCYQLQ